MSNTLLVEHLTNRKKHLPMVFFIILSLLSPIAEAKPNEAPKVVVSITPFYALVAAVMEGVGTPTLLVKPGSSPHHYALKASNIQHLKDAKLIFWGGPNLETYLVKPLQSLLQKKDVPLVIEFDETPHLLLLSIRSKSGWEAHQHGSATTLDNIKDMHFWLDPENAAFLIDDIVKYLSAIDSSHRLQYQKNGSQFKKRLEELNSEITKELKTVRKVPFVVFHDAYQYFENRYKLNAVGAITLHPEMPPSAKRIIALRQSIENKNVQCIFTEPQFEPNLVYSITKDLKIRTGELDPEGQITEANPEGYLMLLKNLSSSFKRCLSNAPPDNQPLHQ